MKPFKSISSPQIHPRKSGSHPSCWSKQRVRNHSDPEMDNMNKTKITRRRKKTMSDQNHPDQMISKSARRCTSKGESTREKKNMCAIKKGERLTDIQREREKGRECMDEMYQYYQQKRTYGLERAGGSRETCARVRVLELCRELLGPELLIQDGVVLCAGDVLLMCQGSVCHPGPGNNCPKNGEPKIPPLASSSHPPPPKNTPYNCLTFANKCITIALQTFVMRFVMRL